MTQQLLQASVGTPATVRSYLEGVQAHLDGVPREERDYLLGQARARVDLALELEHVDPWEASEVTRVLDRLGTPDVLAQRLRSLETPPSKVEPEGRLVACRACFREVSREAMSCPKCGAPWPGRQGWRGWGYEYKSKQRVLGLPLVHVAFGRDEKGKMRVAKGIIAIGQFALGVFTIAQFGVGAVFGLGQFVIAPIAVGQFALGLVALGQFGIGLLYGAGQIATGLLGRLDMFTAAFKK